MSDMTQQKSSIVKDSIKQQAMAPSEPIIQVKSVTWSKDSHGLFDYESKSCTQDKFRTKPISLSIYRNSMNFTLAHCSTAQQRNKFNSEGYQLLTEIVAGKNRDDPRYYVNNGSQEDIFQTDNTGPCKAKESMYLIVRSLKNVDGSNRGHVIGNTHTQSNNQLSLCIEIGQTIKLGRVEYTVIEMKTNSKVQQCEGNIKSFFKNASKFQSLDIERGPDAICKVCLEHHETTQNFMLAPCRCTGSCQYIHIECLRRWVESKVKKQVIGGTAYYNFSKFECEICKCELPKYVDRDNGTTHQLLRIPRPEGPYLMLEEIGEKTRDLIIIQNIPGDGIKLGRGHNCEIRVTDISVSRQHAYIKLLNDRFVLFDNNSKFGTLIKLRKNMPIDAQKKAFQIGRTVITFVLKENKPLPPDVMIMNSVSLPVPLPVSGPSPMPIGDKADDVVKVQRARRSRKQ